MSYMFYRLIHIVRRAPLILVMTHVDEQCPPGSMLQLQLSAWVGSLSTLHHSSPCISVYIDAFNLHLHRVLLLPWKTWELSPLDLIAMLRIFPLQCMSTRILPCKSEFLHFLSCFLSSGFSCLRENAYKTLIITRALIMNVFPPDSTPAITFERNPTVPFPWASLDFRINLVLPTFSQKVRCHVKLTRWMLLSVVCLL